MIGRGGLARWCFKITNRGLKGYDMTYDFDSLIIYYLILQLSPTHPLAGYFQQGYKALTEFYGLNIDDPLVHFLTTSEMKIDDFESKEIVYGKLLIDFKNCFFKTVLPAQARTLTVGALVELGIMINEARLQNAYIAMCKGLERLYQPDKKTITSSRLKTEYGFDDSLLNQNEGWPYKRSVQKLRPNIELVKRFNQ